MTHHLSRRRFLQTAAASGAVLAVGFAPREAAAMTPLTPLIPLIPLIPLTKVA